MSYTMSGATYGSNQSHNSGLLVAGTTSTVTTSVTINYSIKGQMYQKTAITNGATPTTDVNTAAAFRALPASTASMCIFVFALDASGNVKVAQGPTVAAGDVTGGQSAVPFPQLPDTVAPFGYLLVTTTTSLAAAWTFGSSNLSSVTGGTFTFRNLATLPAQPIIA